MFKYISPATLGIILTIVGGVAVLGILIASRSDEIKQNADFVQIAEDLGLNVDQFVADYESQEVADIVEADRKDALARLGAASTPSVFVNGQRINLQTQNDVIVRVQELVEAADEEGSTIELPIVVEVFEDYNCPHCAEFQPTLYQLNQQFGEDVKLEKKHLPFLKDSSTKYSRAAEAARKQGKFEEYHIKLFEMIHGSDFEFEAIGE